MSSFDPDPPKERRAGFFALLVILIVVSAIIVMNEVNWKSRTPYRVAFSMLQDATDIAPGTPILVGGIKYGEVLDVAAGAIPGDAVAPEGESDDAVSGTATGTLVQFEIDSSIRLWSGVRIYRSATVLGGNVSIHISETGFNPRLSVARQPLPANSTIRASNPSSGLNSILGGPVAAQLKQMLEDFDPFKDWLMKVARQDFSARFDPIVASFNSARSKIRGDFDEWSPRITALKSSAGDLTRQLGIGDEESQDPQSMSRMVSKVSQQVRGDFDSVRQDAQAIRADYGAIADDLKSKLGEKMVKAYDEYQLEFARIKTILESLSATGSETGKLWYQMLSEFSLGAGQIDRLFHAVLESVMRAILEKPNAGEINEQERLMVIRMLALRAEEVQWSVDDLEALAKLMEKASPETAVEIRHRAGASLEALKKSLDSFHESLLKQN
ncbi:MAG: hypothetical protein K8R92_06145 [Planctomycetes bacterium]|nr:hypothetical protein [Planctomycetota bacterium]